ncbi:MAG: hypothetical protein HY927_16190 [Elusimicrobia bacterium]|nr:hypothetical protein [Elusimicrobiota bacterium]
MKKRIHTHDVFIAAACVALLAALGVYASWIWSWFNPKHPAPPPALAAPSPRTPADLALARRAYRDRYLDPKTHLQLADALYRAGLFVDAFYVMSSARSFFGEEAFSRAHTLVIAHRGAHFLDGEPFDPSPQSSARLNARLAASPNHPGVLNYLAHIAAARGDVQEALRIVDKALAANPRDKALRLYGAELFGKTLGDIGTAVTWYGKLAALEPDSREGRLALNELGRIAQMRLSGRDSPAPAASQQLLKDIVAAHPDSPAAFSAMALSALARGETDSVRAIVIETLSRNPSHAGARQADGALALLDHAPEAALQALAAAWKLSPDDLYTAEKLAQLNIKHRADPEAALPYCVAIYLQRPSWEDGEPLELVIRRILDTRREEALRGVQPPLLGRFLKAEDASLRAQACERAAQALDPRWIEELGELLDDDTEIVRHNADYALFQLAKAHREAILVRRGDWLDSKSPFVRARALNLLADIDAVNAYPPAEKALFDPNPALRFLTKVMVIDHYYAGFERAEKTVKEYLAWEKDPAVLAFYARMPAPPPKGADQPAQEKPVKKKARKKGGLRR